LSILHVFLVFLGAGMGGVSRYALGRLLMQPTFLPFSVGTLGVNLLGAFCAGLLFALMGAAWLRNHALGLFCMTGFLGGLTTFSAFTAEGMGLLQSNFPLALLHAVVHVFGCLAMFWLATKLVHIF
jgi:CrcB protein